MKNICVYGIIVALFLSGCSMFNTRSQKDTFENLMSYLNNEEIQMSEWRQYNNFSTKYKFQYPDDYFYRDILLDLKILSEIEDESERALYELEKLEIEQAVNNSSNTFYGNDDILLVGYTTKGDFKGKFGVIISPIGAEMSFVFYHNQRRIRLAASQNFPDIDQANIYKYYEKLIDGELQNDELLIWQLFNGVLKTLENTDIEVATDQQ